MKNDGFDGIKVFSATKSADRERLGEVITDWIRSNPDKLVVDKVITQSSDNAFHCLTITLFFAYLDDEKQLDSTLYEERTQPATPRRLAFNERDR